MKTVICKRKKTKQTAQQKAVEKVQLKASSVSSKSESSGWSAVSTVGLFLCFQASGGAQKLHLPFFLSGSQEFLIIQPQFRCFATKTTSEKAPRSSGR